MKTVWVANSGRYSDWSIRGIFSSEEKCREFMDKFKEEDWNDPEEWEVDPLPDRNKHKFPFFVRMGKDGNAMEVDGATSVHGFSDDTRYVNPAFDIEGNLIAHVWAKDKTHAIKIVNERRVGLIAANKWSG